MGVVVVVDGVIYIYRKLVLIDFAAYIINIIDINIKLYHILSLHTQFHIMSAPPSHEKSKLSPKIGPKKAPTSTPSTECECDDLLEIVRGLYQKYEDDEYLKTKLSTHIKTTLPTLLQQKCDERNMREERRKTLEETSDEFIREFINSSAYYYNPSIDLFFVYQQPFYMFELGFNMSASILCKALIILASIATEGSIFLLAY